MTAISRFAPALPASDTRHAPASRLGAMAARMWRSLQRLGQRRAAAQLFELAQRVAPTDADRAGELHAAAQACLRGHN